MPSDARVLALLERAGTAGVTTGEFLEAHIGRAGSAICELRRRGYDIDGVPLSKRRPRGPQRYYLRAAPPSLVTRREEAEPVPLPSSRLDPEPVLPAAGSGQLFATDGYERSGWADAA